MATPFEIHRSPLSPAVALATAPQLGFIQTLVGQHEWQSQAPGYVRRVAVISATAAIAAQLAVDPSLAVNVDWTISDPSDLASTFAELMAYSQANAVEDDNAELAADRKPLTKRGASALIDWLQGQPVNGSRPVPMAARSNTYGPDTLRPARDTDFSAGVPSADAVPAGRYAVDTADGATNALAFYRVDRPTEGRWAGRVFVKLITGGDEQRLSWPTTKTVLAKIAEAGAQAASVRYGHEIGECGVCGRQLTNDDSRAAGIGPVCRAKMAW